MFATSAGMYQCMVDILTCQLKDAKLRWKPRSLEFMVVSHLPVPSSTAITAYSKLHGTSPNGEVILEYKRVESMSVLRVRLDQTGSTVTSAEAKLAGASKGGACFHRHMES